jgi:hypothetical protein
MEIKNGLMTRTNLIIIFKKFKEETEKMGFRHSVLTKLDRDGQMAKYLCVATN